VVLCANTWKYEISAALFTIQFQFIVKGQRK
jgi:hypothetical protein